MLVRVRSPVVPKATICLVFKIFTLELLSEARSLVCSAENWSSVSACTQLELRLAYWRVVSATMWAVDKAATFKVDKALTWRSASAATCVSLSDASWSVLKFRMLLVLSAATLAVCRAAS